MHCRAPYKSALGITEKDFNKTYKVLSKDDLTAIYNKIRRRKSRNREEKEWIALKDKRNRASKEKEIVQEEPLEKKEQENEGSGDAANKTVEPEPPKTDVVNEAVQEDKPETTPEKEKDEPPNKIYGGYGEPYYIHGPFSKAYLNSSNNPSNVQPEKKQNNPYRDIDTLTSRLARHLDQSGLRNHLRPVPDMRYIHTFNNVRFPKENTLPKPKPKKVIKKKVGFKFPEKDKFTKSKGKLSIPAIYGGKKLSRPRGAIKKKPAKKISVEDIERYKETIRLLFDFIDVEKLDEVYKKMVPTLWDMYYLLRDKTDFSCENPERQKIKTDAFVTRFTSVHIYPLYRQNSAVKGIMANLSDILNTDHPEQIVHKILTVHLLASQGLQALERNFGYLFTENGIQPQFINYLYCVMDILLLYHDFFTGHPFYESLTSVTFLCRKLIDLMEDKNAALNPLYKKCLLEMSSEHNKNWNPSTRIERGRNDYRYLI